MNLLVKNALIDQKNKDILIENGIIKEINEHISHPDKPDDIFNACGMITLPSFFNTHTHSAMTLLRGYADDMPLLPWLSEKIWPAEAMLTKEDVYWGTKLACLEMIKTGTTFFNDMYWFCEESVKAACEMGIRSAVSGTLINNQSNFDKLIGDLIKTKESVEKYPQAIFTLGPHAIYTVSKQILKWVGEYAKEHNLFIHTHLSETEKEYQDCISIHGKKPVEYLDSLSMLGPRTILAHCVWLDEDEIELLGEKRVNVSYNPVSNMKLAVGRAMDWKKLMDANVNVTLGTDGCSSNNNLDMMQSMKIGSLLQKFSYNDPCRMNAKDMFNTATQNGAAAFGIKAGKIEVGYEADLMFIKSVEENIPGFDTCSDIVYSVKGSAVDSLICRGKLIMKNRIVEGEEEIIRKVKDISAKFQ